MILISYARPVALLIVFSGIILGVNGCSNYTPSSESVGNTRWTDRDGNIFYFKPAGSYSASVEGYSEYGSWKQEGNLFYVEAQKTLHYAQNRQRIVSGHDFTFRFNGAVLERLDWLSSTPLTRMDKLPGSTPPLDE